jgi:uncharacterized protein YndB with AHSA1/START domain
MVEAIREGDIPGVQLRCRQALTLPVAEAWSWLVEPVRLERWLAERVEVVPGAGGSLHLVGRGPEGTPREERGRTLDIAPPGRWVLAFERLGAGWTAATRLTLELAPRPEGSEVSVHQLGFHHLPLSLCMTAWEAYRHRWRDALGRLAEAAMAAR